MCNKRIDKTLTLGESFGRSVRSKKIEYRMQMWLQYWQLWISKKREKSINRQRSFCLLQNEHINAKDDSTSEQKLLESTATFFSLFGDGYWLYFWVAFVADVHKIEKKNEIKKYGKTNRITIHLTIALPQLFSRSCNVRLPFSVTFKRKIENVQEKYFMNQFRTRSYTAGA